MKRIVLIWILIPFVLSACGHEHTNPCDPKSDNYNFDRATFQKFSDMAWVKIPKGNTCGFLIDKFENSLIDASSESPGFDKERASKSVASLMPASCITFENAKQLCEKAGKRLCTKDEWLTACKGGFFDDPTSKKLRDDPDYGKYTQEYKFPYTRATANKIEPVSDKYLPGICNDYTYAEKKNNIKSLKETDYACSNKNRKILTTPAGSLYGEGDSPGCWVARTFTVNTDIRGVPQGTYSYIDTFDPNSTYAGIFDLSGNLYEWVVDENGNPVAIGGSFLSNNASQLTCDESAIDRSRDPKKEYPDVGFRCCRNIDM